jgi:hypothetical protein
VSLVERNVISASCTCNGPELEAREEERIDHGRFMVQLKQSAASSFAFDVDYYTNCRNPKNSNSASNTPMYSLKDSGVLAWEGPAMKDFDPQKLTKFREWLEKVPTDKLSMPKLWSLKT